MSAVIHFVVFVDDPKDAVVSSDAVGMPGDGTPLVLGDRGHQRFACGFKESIMWARTDQQNVLHVASGEPIRVSCEKCKATKEWRIASGLVESAVVSEPESVESKPEPIPAPESKPVAPSVPPPPVRPAPPKPVAPKPVAVAKPVVEPVAKQPEQATVPAPIVQGTDDDKGEAAIMANTGTADGSATDASSKSVLPES